MNWRKDEREKKARQWDRTHDRISSEQRYDLVEWTAVSHARGRVFDPAVMLFFFSSIHYGFLLF